MKLIANILTIFFGYVFLRSLINNLQGMKPIQPRDENDTRSDHLLAAFQHLNGSMAFSSFSFIMLTLSSGAAAYLEKPQDILMWCVEIAGVIFLLNWFLRTILMRDGIIDFIAIVFGLSFLYVASGFSVTYTAFAALFVAFVTSIRVSIWWFNGGREVVIDKTTNFEESFMASVFAWVIRTFYWPKAKK